MEGAGALLGPAEAVRAEIVHESGRTRVTRMFFAGGTVIRKEPLGPDAARRLAHEAAMLARLRGVAGVAQLAEGPRHPGSVVLADAGDKSLAGLARPLAADDLIRLAVPRPRGGGHAPPGGDPPRHHGGQRRALRRRSTLPRRLRARDVAGENPP